MYKNARALPKRGFAARGGATGSSISNGPTPYQRQTTSAYNARIMQEAERQRRGAAERAFAATVENAGLSSKSPMVWRLMIWNVPDRLSGLLARLGFVATKKNPAHWWRLYDPDTDKAKAVAARAALLDASLSGKWSEVSRPPARNRGRAK